MKPPQSRFAYGRLGPQWQSYFGRFWKLEEVEPSWKKDVIGAQCLVGSVSCFWSLYFLSTAR
jgi:hypothetical protein